jgi:ribosomal protein L37E
MTVKKLFRETKDEWCEVEITLKEDNCLSVTGAYGRKKRLSRHDEIYCRRNGKNYYLLSCGQITDYIKEFFPEVGPYLKWHLNDMKPDCEHQEKEGWNKRPIDPHKPLDSYGKFFPGQVYDTWNMLAWVTPKEYPRGLLTVKCSECGYGYGTKWLKRELPAEVIEWFNSLTDEGKNDSIL